MTEEQIMSMDNQFQLLNNLLEDILASTNIIDEYPSELRTDINILFEKLEKIEELLQKS